MRRYPILVVAGLLLLALLSGPFQIIAFADEPNEPQLDIVKNEFILESAKIADMGMETARNLLLNAFHENITEAEVVRAINNAMTDNGSSEYVEAFGVIVASGKQSALPHGDDSDDETNLILQGEVVVVDLGARYNGYCSDLTRTFFMGNATPEMMDIYNITLEAQEAAIETVQTGVWARDVDAAARDVIAGYGYGENFIHALGHGIGLYIHMPPTLSPSSNEILFESGDMCVTIEPGIYLEEQFGVRIEDDVFVQRGGNELLTFFPRSLEDAILIPENITNDTTEFHKQSDEGGSAPGFIFTFGILILAASVGVVYVRSRRKRV